MSFKDTDESKKGDIGENIVRRFLELKKYIVYKAITDGPHPLDCVVFKVNNTFPRLVEIKTYPRRNLYPDTGINYNHYKIYKKQKSDVYLFFVDELEKRVYGNKLSVLDQEIKFQETIYPKVLTITKGKKKGQKRIYFPLILMESYCGLTDGTSNKIKEHHNRNYNYDSAKKFDFKWLKNESWK